MTERHFDDPAKQSSADSQFASNLASDTWELIVEHPKTAAILTLGVMGGAMILTHGEAAGIVKATAAESKLPSAALGFTSDNGPGTVVGLMDDMVRSGRYTYVDGVMKPVGERALKPLAELPSTLLKADNSPGTVAELLDKMVTNGDYKVVGDPNSAFFYLKPVGASGRADIAAAEASFWKGK